jgi:hypothetical protein
MCSDLVDDEVDGPLEVVLEAAITPRMTATISKKDVSNRVQCRLCSLGSQMATPPVYSTR